jgi:hypothetical protein
VPIRHDASGREKEATIAAALRLRAVDVRALRVADDTSLRALLVPPPAQRVESLCACDVSAEALNLAFDALAGGADGARAQLPARLRLQRVLLSDATGLPECDASRLLTRPVAVELTNAAVAAKNIAAAASTEAGNAAAVGAEVPDATAAAMVQVLLEADAAFASAADAARLHIRLAPAFLKYNEADEDDMGNDMRVVRCARLGRALARQTWPRVTVELFELDDSLTETEEGGSAALATLLEVCFSSMQDELDTLHLAPLALDRRCTFDLRKSGASLDVSDARRVARAAPPHVTLFFAGVLLDSAQDADDLAVMLAAGRVTGAEITLRNSATAGAPLMSRVAVALSAAAAADGSDFSLNLGHNCINADAHAYVFNSLRGLALRGLRMNLDLDDDTMTALVSVLPPSLRKLTFQVIDVTNTTPLLVAALLAGQLPLLECLTLASSRLKDSESARNLAQFLQRCRGPFSMHCEFVEDAAAWDVLTTLLKSAPPSSGVPAYAASVLRSFTGPMPVDELPELVAAAFAALRHDSDACVLNSDTFASQACQPDYGTSAFAGLLLHLHDRAPAEMAPLLSLPQHVLLVAARVLRARSQLAAPDDLLFTPLLHRMLLVVAGRMDTLPLFVLSAVAAACKRDEPADLEDFEGTDEELEQQMGRVNESRRALLALLLAGALVGEAAFGDPVFADARSWLAHHKEWLLESVPLFCAQAADPAAGVRFLGRPTGLGVSLSFSACDAALHLWAVSRIPSLAGALWDIGEGDTRLYFLRTSWVSKVLADPIAELICLEALDGLLLAASGVFELAVVHLHVPGFDGLSGWCSVLDVDALRARLSSLEQRRDAARANSPAAAGALAVAHSYVATILRRCQEALAAPGVASALHCCAQLTFMTASPTPEPDVLDSVLRELNCVLLQWMREGAPPVVPGTSLLSRAWEITFQLYPPDWNSLPPPPVVLAHTAFLACCLSVQYESLCVNVPFMCARTSGDITVLLKSIIALHASAVAADPGCKSFSSVAHVLLAAGEVVSRCPADDLGARCGGDFGAVVSQLLVAGWVRANEHALDTNTVETAAAAYDGLAHLVVTSNALQALSAHLSNGRAPAVLDRLGGEMVQLALLRCRLASGAVDPPPQSVAALDDARAKLRKLLRVLLPALEPLISSADQPLTAYADAALAAARSVDI